MTVFLTTANGQTADWIYADEETKGRPKTEVYYYGDMDLLMEDCDQHPTVIINDILHWTPDAYGVYYRAAEDTIVCDCWARPAPAVITQKNGRTRTYQPYDVCLILD
jgi:hypothetical protein